MSISSPPQRVGRVLLASALVTAASTGCITAMATDSTGRDWATGAAHNPVQGLITAEASVEIDAPIAEVWAYLADNTHAKEWSVYFDHITSLPSDVPAGTLHSLRRCYRMPDETGLTWDEEVVALEPQKLRQIRTYDIRGTGLAVADDAEYSVWQLYEPLSPTRTKVTFRTALKDQEAPIKGYLFVLQRSEVVRIFRLNLENIAAAIEQGPNYVRPHPWEPPAW